VEEHRLKPFEKRVLRRHLGLGGTKNGKLEITE
jgi:hypothetical protein